MKKRVLVFCEFYRPGFKSGGGMWTVANLVDRLGDHYEFSVVCRNHDGAGDRTPYTGVVTGEWNDLFGHKAFYVDQSTFSKGQVRGLVDDVDPDVIFVNSVFGLTTRMLLEARRKGLIGKVPMIVAPCGELSAQCLSIKPLKKAAFLKYAKLFGLYREVAWKATRELEASEIRSQFGGDATIKVAPDLVPASILPDFSLSDKPPKEPGLVRLVSVARIAPKKNIDYVLRRLSECGSGRFELELIGGIDDENYWKECERSIALLPQNVIVRFLGALNYPEVLQRLVASHFFVLPTLNENFGYVFVEAMAAGCPLLISENTIWDRVEEAGCGRVVRLDSPARWVEALESFAAMGPEELAAMSGRAREFAIEWLRSSGDVEANRAVFESVITGGSNGKSNVRRA